MASSKSLRRHLKAAFVLFYVVWLGLVIWDGEGSERTRAFRGAAIGMDVIISGYLVASRREEEE